MTTRNSILGLFTVALVVSTLGGCGSTAGNVCSKLKECYAADYAKQYGTNDAKCEDKYDNQLADAETKHGVKCRDAMEASMDCAADVSCSDMALKMPCKTERDAEESACK